GSNGWGRKVRGCSTACSTGGWRHWLRTSASVESSRKTIWPNCASWWSVSMTMADGWSLLIQTTMASSVAILVVNLLRRPLRTCFGARAAYCLWMLVPASVLAVLLPPAVTPVVSMVSLGLPVGATAAGGSALAASRDSSLPWLAVLWAIGASVMLATQIWQQR